MLVSHLQAHDQVLVMSAELAFALGPSAVGSSSFVVEALISSLSGTCGAKPAGAL